ncbi:MAG: cache domain-containing protein [Pseudomonadota bacterium]
MKKQLFKNLKIRQKIMLTFTCMVVLLAVIFGGYTVLQTQSRVKADMAAIEKSLTEQAQQKLNDHVQAAFTVVDRSYNLSTSPEAIINRFGPHLKDLVDLPLKIIQAEYDKIGPNVSGQEEQRRIMVQDAKTRAQKQIGQFRYGGSGYFWINDAKPSMIMHPIVPQLDGQDLAQFSKDGQIVLAEGTKTPMFQEMVKKTKDSPQKEGFVMYPWPHPLDTKRWVRKISYVRLFEPWDWIVGTGVYVDQAEEEARGRALETLRALQFGQGEYTFVLSADCVALIHPDEELKGKDISSFKDGAGRAAYREMVDQAVGSGHGMVEFQRPGNGRAGQKMASVRFFPEWKWVIGAEIYVDDIRSEIIERKKILNAEMKNQVIFIALAVVAVIVLSLLTAFWFCLRYVEGPLQTSVKILKNVARGEIGERMGLEQTDEIGELSSALGEMTAGLEEKAQLALKIADGDLSSEIRTASDKDMLGAALQTMVLKLNQVIWATRQVSAQVSAGSRQVSGSSQSLSEGASRQAASLEEITSSLTVVRSQTKMNAEHAREADKLTNEARQAADAGDHQMEEMISAMKGIQEASKEISKIIKTIDDIAFQTNLLALNAAVEAARAGKHGKGFAVVAQEVRNLAARSAKAAHETELMIQESVRKVDLGTKLLDLTAESLKGIVDKIGCASHLMDEISAASTQQAEGITQINLGLDQIEQVTYTVSANSEQTASAAVQLSAQAAHLEKSLAVFKLKNGARHFPASGLAAEKPEIFSFPTPPRRLPGSTGLLTAPSQKDGGLSS